MQPLRSFYITVETPPHGCQCPDRRAAHSAAHAPSIYQVPAHERNEVTAAIYKPLLILCERARMREYGR